MDNPIEIRGLSGALGAEIHGLDLSRPLSGNEKELLLDAFHRYGVLCIRDQKLTRDAQIALAKVFGTPDVHPIAQGMPEHPEVIQVRKPAGEEAFFGTSWHTDNSFFEKPTAVTILFGEQVPPHGHLFCFFAIDDRPSHLDLIRFLHRCGAWIDQLSASTRSYPRARGPRSRTILAL